MAQQTNMQRLAEMRKKESEIGPTITTDSEGNQTTTLEYYKPVVEEIIDIEVDIFQNAMQQNISLKNSDPKKFKRYLLMCKELDRYFPDSLTYDELEIARKTAKSGFKYSEWRDFLAMPIILSTKDSEMIKIKKSHANKLILDAASGRINLSSEDIRLLTTFSKELDNSKGGAGGGVNLILQQINDEQEEQKFEDHMVDIGEL